MVECRLKWFKKFCNCIPFYYPHPAGNYKAMNLHVFVCNPSDNGDKFKKIRMKNSPNFNSQFIDKFI